jgi:DNA-binding Lrp family transcriptional regulator
LGKGGTTYWVAYSGGGYVYVGGYLRDLSELDPYVSLVKKEAEMGDPTVGIMPQMSSRFPNESLRPLDYQILASLHKNSRKPVAEVASEVHASAKTVHRRLERMVEKELVDFSIDWYPDASNDIISICHVGIAPGADRARVLSDLKKRLSESILVDTVFSNLPNQVVLFLWTNSMRQMDDLRELISRSGDVGSVTTNVLQIGYMFDTWRDRLTPEDQAEKIPASG